jgi:hypothetical protein
MNTENLILALVRDGAPVRPILPPAMRSVVWGAASVAWVAAGSLLLGLRGDLGACIHGPRFLVQLLLLLGATGLSAGAAFRLSTPGEKFSGRALFFALVPLLLWGGWMLLAAGGSEAGPGTGVHCVRNLLVLGVPPGILLFFLLKRALPLHTGWAGLLATTGAAALADAGTCFICLHENPWHILVWHFLPVAALGLAGIAIGRKFFSRDLLPEKNTSPPTAR